MKGKMKMKMKMKRDGVVHHNTRKYLEKKLSILLKTFKPIPFVPRKALNLSTHEALLKRAGLWDFVHTEFDSELRTDLVAQLVVGYNPDTRPHRRSVVNGFLVEIDKIQMGCALGLPKLKGEESCELGRISNAEVLFLEKVIFNWIVLDGHNGGEVVLDEVMQILWKERRPEKVEWAGLMWAMVESELVKGVELEECWYASHLQFFLRKVKPSLFDDVEKEGYGRRGMIGKIVRCGGVKLESGEEVSCLAVEGGGADGAGGQGSDVSDDCGTGGWLEDVGGLVVLNGNGDILRGGWGETETGKEIKGKCLVNGEEFRMGEVCEGSTGLNVQDGKEEVLKQDDMVKGWFGDASAMEIVNEESGLLDDVADMKISIGEDDMGKLLETEYVDLLCEQGNADQLKSDEDGEDVIGVETDGSGDSYAMQGKQRVGFCVVQIEQQLKIKQDESVKGGFGEVSAMKIEGEESGSLGDVADVKINGEDNDTGKLLENEGMIGVETGGSSDSYAMKQGNEQLGFCSVHTAQELKAKEDLKQDDMVMGDVSAMQIENEKNGVLYDVAEENGGKRLENEDVDLIGKQGKVDQLKLDEEDELFEISTVRTNDSGDSYAMKQENEQVGFWSLLGLLAEQESTETWSSAQMKERKLAKEVEHLDNMIKFHETTKHKELQQRDLKINCLENSLFFIANQIDDYKKALQAINESFAAFRERCEVPAEPLYRDVKGSGASH